MDNEFPNPVPEIPVNNVDEAAAYYENCFDFSKDWGGDDGGIAQLSRGRCRIFLTNEAFRQHSGNAGPVVIWLNLDNKTEVDELYEEWSNRGARIISEPESKPWNLHEFTATDTDGNRLRIFYDFTLD